MNFLKKLLCKICGEYYPDDWTMKFNLYNPIHYGLCETFVNSLGGYYSIHTEKNVYVSLALHLKKNNVDIDFHGYLDFVREYDNRYLRTITFSSGVSGTDSYSCGSKNVLKKLPKRDSKGRFSK